MQRKDLMVGGSYAVTPGTSSWASEANSLGVGSEEMQVDCLARLWSVIRPMELTVCAPGTAPLTMVDRSGQQRDVTAHEIVAPFDEIMSELKVRRLHLSKHFEGSLPLSKTRVTLDMLALREQFDDRLWVSHAALAVDIQHNYPEKTHHAKIALRVSASHTFYAVAELLPEAHAAHAQWLRSGGELGLSNNEVLELLNSALDPVSFSYGQITGVNAAMIDRVLTRLEEVTA